MHNIILIGGRISNPWAELFEDHMNFTSESKDLNGMVTVIRDRAPSATEQLTYNPIHTPTQSVEYCSIAYLPNPNHNGKILVVEGTTWAATDAGVEFLLSDNQLSELRKKMHTSEFPYFEVLLKTSRMLNTSFGTTLEAYRTYPGLH